MFKTAAVLQGVTAQCPVVLEAVAEPPSFPAGWWLTGGPGRERLGSEVSLWSPLFLAPHKLHHDLLLGSPKKIQKNIPACQDLSLCCPRTSNTLSCDKSGSGIHLRLGRGGLKEASAPPANGHGVSFWGDGNVLELDSADRCTT